MNSWFEMQNRAQQTHERGKGRKVSETYFG